MYGHTLGATVALGYVSNPDGVSDAFVNAGQFEIDIGGKRHGAGASVAPLYDPRNLRVRT
jgi:4-methylaminobutanoate oxidase (formaldehyde-forming)